MEGDEHGNPSPGAREVHEQAAVLPRTVFARVPRSVALVHVNVMHALRRALAEREHDGVLIRNGSPNIDQVYRNTIWEGRAWERALRSLDGAFSLKNPVYFTGASANGSLLTASTPNIDPITMANGSTIKAQPSSISNGAFSVAWKHS